MADGGVKVPKLGKVPKPVLITVGVGALGYVGYRYWQARQAPAGDGTFDPGMEDPGTIPAVAGASVGGASAGSGDSTQTSNSSAITTNAEWVQFVTDQLTQSDRFERSAVQTALGNWLTGQQLTYDQEQIVRAAIAVGGYPPVGGDRPINPGGNVPITVAPSGVVVTNITPTSAQVTFQPVSGARSYNVYRSGSSAPSGTATASPITIDGLNPNTAYTVTVAAVTGSGSVGPKSSVVSFRTSGVTMPAPAKPALVSVTNNRATLKTNSVPYATSYRWTLNGKLLNTTDGPMVTATQLRSKTTYSVAVQADTSTGNPGPLSPTLSFKTK